MVHAVLILEREIAEDAVRGLVQQLDDDLVSTADRPREDFVVTVYQGVELVVISDEDDQPGGGGEDEERLFEEEPE